MPNGREVLPQLLMPDRTNVDFSLWTGVKLGAGFAVGVTLVSLIFWVMLIVLLGASLAGLGR